MTEMAALRKQLAQAHKGDLKVGRVAYERMCGEELLSCQDCTLVLSVADLLGTAPAIGAFNRCLRQALPSEPMVSTFVKVSVGAGSVVEAQRAAEELVAKWELATRARNEATAALAGGQLGEALRSLAEAVAPAEPSLGRLVHGVQGTHEGTTPTDPIAKPSLAALASALDKALPSMKPKLRTFAPFLRCSGKLVRYVLDWTQKLALAWTQTEFAAALALCDADDLEVILDDLTKCVPVIDRPELALVLDEIAQNSPRKGWELRVAGFADEDGNLDGGEKLSELDISSEQAFELAGACENLARSGRRGEVIDEFVAWMDDHGDFDVMVDGANVGRYHTNYAGAIFSHAQIDTVMEELHSQGLRPLLVLHGKWVSPDTDLIVGDLPQRKIRKLPPLSDQRGAKPTTRRPADALARTHSLQPPCCCCAPPVKDASVAPPLPQMRAPAQSCKRARLDTPSEAPSAATVSSAAATAVPSVSPEVVEYYAAKWRERGWLYTPPVYMNDDLYWIYAALRMMWQGRDVIAVTRDELRDHEARLTGLEKEFALWKQRHIVPYDFQEVEDKPIQVRFFRPPQFGVRSQRSKRGSWLLPVVGPPAAPEGSATTGGAVGAAGSTGSSGGARWYVWRRCEASGSITVEDKSSR
eukprot:TRINITY_DN34396_c0_g1_i1.p1 TRINITY_DN34396_c0_g1~~TRINITY_DN34396_c0_g1_i1.p1  ORF type:complete len:641 (-),score=100.06 TRINITY_DN34396_c0_g1_i1:80-2002(-)